jgi:hypothetical protein
MARPKSIPLRLAEAEGDVEPQETAPDEQAYWLDEATYSADDRKALAKKGQAMPDGSFPTPDIAALDDAIQAWGRSKSADRPALKRYLARRAKALGADRETLARIKALAEADAAGNPSLDEQAEDIRQAWWDSCRSMATDNPWTAPGYSSYPVETYPDHIVVRAGEDFWSIPFSRTNADGDGAEDITFDVEAATKVERRWIAVEAEGEEWLIAPIREAEGDEPSGSEWEVVIIKSGASKNRRIYPEAVLKKAAPLFEGVRVLARSDQDHVEGTEKSVKNIVGWIDGVKFAKGALRGIFHVSEAASWLKTLLLDAWKRGKKDLVGLSIVAEGRGKPVRKDGQQFVEVEEISRVSSTDVVFDPAAGGGFLKLVAAEGEEESDVDPKLIAALKEAEAAVVRALLSKLSEADVEAIKTAHPDLAEKITEAMALNDEPAKEEPKAAPKAKATKVTEAEEDGDGEDEDLVPKSMGRFVITAALAETKLPEAARTLVTKRITKRFEGQRFTEAELSEAIADEVDGFAELEQAGLVKSAGTSREERVEVGVGEAQKGMAALDGFFANKDQVVEGVRVPRYRSFRQAYVDLTGDDGLTGRWSEASDEGRWPLAESENGTFKLSQLLDRRAIRGWSLAELREAIEGDGLPLIEAIQSTTFSNALGDSVTRAMLREYSQLNLATWQDLVDIVPAKDFRTQRRERFGGYANLPTVAQNATYAALTSPSDEEATYAVTKRGGLETITIEAIANDDVGMLRRIPLRLARAAAQTLHEFVFDFMRTNPTIYDSVALFAGGHNNLGSTALGVTSLAAARIRMRKQAQMGNSKRLGLMPRHLWIPIDLEQTAYELTQSDGRPDTADRAANYIRGTGITYVVVDYWSDANDWFVTADKSQTPLIELAFFGSENPELFEQNNPNVGDLFTNDRIVYKIRHIFGGAVVDFRGFDGSLVA